MYRQPPPPAPQPSIQHQHPTYIPSQQQQPGYYRPAPYYPSSSLHPQPHPTQSTQYSPYPPLPPPPPPSQYPPTQSQPQPNDTCLDCMLLAQPSFIEAMNQSANTLQ